MCIYREIVIAAYVVTWGYNKCNYNRLQNYIEIVETKSDFSL